MPIRLVPVQVEFLPHGDNEPLSDNKKKVFDADGNPKPDEWMPGKGKRMFPDAKDKNDTTPRDTVDVKVSIGMPNTKVYLKVIDVDDPTPSNKDPEHIIDPNDQGGEKGDDNHGAAAVFTNGNAVQIECTTDADGIAKVGSNLPELKVTGQPGNNYRVAVTILKPDDMSVLQVSNKGGNGYVSPDGESVKGFNGGVSPMLTVWRKLNLEVDSMQAIPSPKPEPDRKSFSNAHSVGSNTFSAQPSQGTLPLSSFYDGGYVKKGSQKTEITSYTVYSTPPNIGLVKFELGAAGLSEGDSFDAYDDDDKYLTEIGLSAPLPRNDTHADVVNKIQSHFSLAYIEVIDANAKGWNQSQTISYENNFPTISRNSVAQGVRDLPDKNSFWAHQLIFVYQDTAANDGDPGDEDLLLGATFETATNKWSAVGLETNREAELGFIPSTMLANPAAWPTYRSAYQRRLMGTVAHEIGHAPGDLSDEHSEEGLMREGGDYIDVEFSPKTILRFRKTNRWDQ